MKVELKNYKRFSGHDGQGFETTLYIDGKKVAIISDDGWGGEWNWHVQPECKEIVKKFQQKCLELPQIKGYGETMLDMDADLWISEYLLERADMKKHAGSKVQLYDTADGKFYSMGKYNAKQREQLITYIKAKYPTCELINGNPVVAIL